MSKSKGQKLCNRSNATHSPTKGLRMIIITAIYNIVPKQGP